MAKYWPIDPRKDIKYILEGRDERDAWDWAVESSSQCYESMTVCILPSLLLLPYLPFSLPILSLSPCMHLPFPSCFHSPSFSYISTAQSDMQQLSRPRSKGTEPTRVPRHHTLEYLTLGHLYDDAFKVSFF